MTTEPPSDGEIRPLTLAELVERGLQEARARAAADPVGMLERTAAAVRAEEKRTDTDPFSAAARIWRAAAQDPSKDGS